MIAVGIDVSKSKSTVAILDSYGTVLATPFNMAHNQPEMNALVSRLKAFDEPVTILLEYTGHYHYPVLKKLQDEGFPVCVVNPYQMKKYGDVEIHKAKTDKKDALRIATYALEKSYKLVPYSFMEQKYEDLKFLSRQYDQRIAFSDQHGELGNELHDTLGDDGNTEVPALCSTGSKPNIKMNPPQVYMCSPS